jgi:glycosyltransferase involved in cell wall biosynthesis
MTDKRLSVMLFTHSTPRGGAEEQMRLLAAGLDRRYFHVHMACPHELANRLRPDLAPDVELIPIDLTRPTCFREMFQLWRCLREHHIDILHCHHFFSSLLASPVAWVGRVPVIIETAHGREAWRRGWKDQYIIDRMVGRLVDAYSVVSKANAEYLIDVKRYPARKISVIHPGSDLSKFDPSRPAPAGLRESLGISGDDPVVVMVGRLEPQKGHRVLLDAMPAVRERFPRVKLICAGEGALRAELEAQTKSLGLEETVRFIGYPRDIRDYLALATITVLPSFYEGMPVTPVESLACRRTVVATAVDGTPDVVVDGKTGLTVPAGDSAQLAQAMCKLLGDEHLRDTLARQGRQWVMENFSVEQMVNRFERFYWTVWQRHAAMATQAKRVSMPCSAITQ